jgi:hypothetical protein
MKKFNLYITDCNSNGTNNLIVCDNDNQVQHVIEEAVFNGPFCPEDRLGGVTALYYGESVGYIDYSAEIEGEEGELDEDRTLAEAVLEGDYSDIEPVSEISLKALSNCLAVSPVDPEGTNLIERLKVIGIVIS